MNIGFVSTRFAGTDGVSLESAKWAEVLWRDKHVSFWYSGRSDRHPDISHCIPEAHFAHPENQWINDRIWGRSQRDKRITDRIQVMKEYLKQSLYDFVKRYSIDVLVPENALTIPMHIPLALAITEFLIETQTAAVAHHHDFYWERIRFSITAVQDYLDMAFPPKLPMLMHSVINQAAQEQLALRKGVGSHLIPNVFDFEKPPPRMDAYSKDVREEIGLAPDDIFILQPTRIVPRKGIEHAIKLVGLLNDQRCKLVISHQAGDEGTHYKEMLLDMAREEGVDIRLISDRIGEIRQRDSFGRKIYTLWDLYPHADLVTYPSIYEGFGNALLESIYFRVPVLINRYSIFATDIEPKGFLLPVIDGFITQKILQEVKRILLDTSYRNEMVRHNYRVGRQYFSYTTLQRSLRSILNRLTGWELPQNNR